MCRKGKKKKMYWLIVSTKKREENDRWSYRSHIYICEGKKRKLIGWCLASNQKTMRKEHCHSTSGCQSQAKIVIRTTIFNSRLFLPSINVSMFNLTLRQSIQSFRLDRWSCLKEQGVPLVALTMFLSSSELSPSHRHSPIVLQWESTRVIACWSTIVVSRW